MKHILSALLLSLVFFGCAANQRVVEIKNPPAEVKERLGKSINNLGEEINNEQIDGIEENVIVEEENYILERLEPMNLAVTYPSNVVGNYAKSSMNTILGYLSYRKINFDVKAFDSQVEDIDSIQNAFNQIKEEGFTKVIALYSPKALELLHLVDTSGLTVYLPLVNRNDVLTPNENFIYGAISYDEQIIKLNEYSNFRNAMFFQESYIGKKLKEKYEQAVLDTKIVKPIKNKRNYYKGIIKDERLNDSTLYLNTNIVKTSIILSQITVHEITPRVVLSTQINYNPKLFILTQEQDRTNFVIANSIDRVDEKLEDEIESFGGDIKYNWVDYSTLVGVNYLYDMNSSNLVKTQIEENQVLYMPKLYKSTAYGFLEIK